MGNDLLKNLTTKTSNPENKTGVTITDKPTIEAALGDTEVGPDLKELSELELSIEALEAARRGRSLNNIPLGDEYWDKLKEHQAAYQRSKD